MIHSTGVTLAQLRVPDGTTEITQVDMLLADLPVENGTRVILTLDAGYTQHDTAMHVAVELGFDYIRLNSIRNIKEATEAICRDRTAPSPCWLPNVTRRHNQLP